MTAFGLADPGAFAGRTLTFINRCRRRGLMTGEGTSGFSTDARATEAALNLGLQPLAQEKASPLRAAVPRIAVYAGDAIGYPYWGYYAHALLSIGLGFRPILAADIIKGALADYDLLVMPGGFATWGLDRAEGTEGIDAAIAEFVRNGGAFIGSCGGAFYASAGRPGWLGAIDAMPKFTQEYLLTGAAVLGISVNGPVIGRGLPETIEIPYYHGPVYSSSERSAETLGHFRNFISESRLFIDNPLPASFFDREMKGTPAVMMSAFGKGKVLVFSPHPEMGEFVRKGIALEGYVRRFAEIRGFRVMDETLRFFMKEDCAGFRLIHNAIACLGLFEQKDGPEPAPFEPEPALDMIDTLQAVDDALASRFGKLIELSADESTIMQRLIETEIERLQAEWTKVRETFRRTCAGCSIDRDVKTGLSTALQAAAAQPAPTRLADLLVATELPVRLTAAALRTVNTDRALETI